MKFSKEELLKFYETMLKIRKFEEKVSDLFSDGHIPGFLHLYIGQEAVATGVCSNLKKDDYIASTHRGHGHCIAKGADVNKMMAELFGKETGYCKGKGGSMHVADIDIGILGANGIVGAGIPIAVGAGLTAKVKGQGQVAVAFFGEGASGIGYFHEALNMAAVLKLPVIFVCESNNYAEFTPREKHLPIQTVAERGSAYGIKSYMLDGNDVLAVYETFDEVVSRTRKGEGPFLVECFTDRWSGHFVGDPQRYRPLGEKEELQNKDPIIKLKVFLQQEYENANDEINKIHQTVDNELAYAEEFSKSSPLPHGESTLEDVYAQGETI